MNDFAIRPAVPADTRLIVTLIRKLAEYEKLQGQCILDEETLADSLFVKKTAEAVIGELDGTPVGYGLFFHNFSTFLGRAGLYIEDIFVLPEYRGRGFGRAFFRYFAGVARKRGCARMEWTCLDWNAPSRRFYEGLGAKPMGEWIIHRLDEVHIRRLTEE